MFVGMMPVRVVVYRVVMGMVMVMVMHVIVIVIVIVTVIVRVVVAVGGSIRMHMMVPVFPIFHAGLARTASANHAHGCVSCC
jgi:hypothetical protein